MLHLAPKVPSRGNVGFDPAKHNAGSRPSSGGRIRPRCLFLFGSDVIQSMSFAQGCKCALAGGGRARPGGLRPWFRAGCGEAQVSKGRRAEIQTGILSIQVGWR
jgi:hypothetical protein